MPYIRSITQCKALAATHKVTCRRHLLYGEWDYLEWRQQHLPDYLKMCGLFKEEVEAALGVNNRPYTHGHAVEDTHREDKAAEELIREH